MGSRRSEQAFARAVQQFQAGQLAGAEQLARQSLAVARTPEVLHLLGIIASQTDRADEAVQLLTEAAKREPGSAEIHNSLGNTLAALGRHTDAVISYRRAVQLSDRYVAAHHHLALSLRELGARAEAQEHLLRALALKPDDAEAHVSLAALLADAGELTAALEHLGQAVALAPGNARAFNDLGTTLLRVGKTEEAVAAFHRAVTLAPTDTQARGNLAITLKALGRRDLAGTLLIDGWRLLPQGGPARRTLLPFFLDVLGDAAQMPLEAAWREVALHLLTDEAIGPDSISMGLSRGLSALPAVVETLCLGGEGIDGLDATGVRELLADPLLQAALTCVLLRDPELERALTYLRRWTLRRVTGLSAGPAAPAAFVCALARQCHASEYAWFVAPDEPAILAPLLARVEAALADAAADPLALEEALQVIALYQSLDALAGRARLQAAQGWSAPFAGLHRQQIANPARERVLRAGLPVLTAISDRTSQAVRQMYEENPYPRWLRSARPAPLTTDVLIGRLRPGEPLPQLAEPVPVLVAGCGTGHHAVLVARELVDSAVLAVDLSRASLAYAARMIEELGLDRVQLAQADLLELGSLDRRFAVIECGGVLHHLADPVAGWRTLLRLLDPRGVMKVGLYSTLARRHLIATRELLVARGLPATPEGIREGRRAILDLPKDDPARAVTASPDFYASSPFRDLLLHVQEQTFTLPEIAESLDRLDLRFLGFVANRSLLTRFRAMFPARDAQTDLGAWDAFERARPATFSNMYQFYCCPKP